MKRYEGLFILNNASREEAVKDTIDKVSSEINSLGGKVETVQKMDKRSFSRVANKKHSSGYYVNVIFTSPASALPQLQTRFALNDEVFRVMFTEAPAGKAEAKQI
ncbi:MAG TPA: 30S ribosomal protein S6 [Verrucomicrobiae bacterium]|nr:30S ribosomal protein S6 [Verrucomicrobiae bacterium]